jgi:hypothetical protein
MDYSLLLSALIVVGAGIFVELAFIAEELTKLRRIAEKRRLNREL